MSTSHDIIIEVNAALEFFRHFGRMRLNRGFRLTIIACIVGIILSLPMIVLPGKWSIIRLAGFCLFILSAGSLLVTVL